MADTDKKFLDDDGVSQFAEETKNYVDNKFSQLDDKYVRSDDTTIIRLRNQNEINLQEDHNNAWFGYRDGKVNNWRFGNGTEGGLADVYANDYYLGDEKLSDTFIRVDDTTIVKLVNDNEINLQEDHNNAWFGYRGGKVTNWKFGDGTEGGLADVYVKDLYLGDQKLSDLLGDKANDADVVHKSGAETIDGTKTFINPITITRPNIGTTGYVVKLTFKRGDAIASVNHATFRVTDSENNIVSDVCTENYTDGKVAQILNVRNTNAAGAQVQSSISHLLDKTGDQDWFYSVRDGKTYLGTSAYRWADVNTVLLNGKTPAYDADVVHKSGNETINGVKTFNDLQTISYGTQYKGSRNAYILPEFAAGYSGLCLTTLGFSQTLKIGNFVLDDNNKPALDIAKGYIQIATGENNNVNTCLLEPRNCTVSQLGTSVNKWSKVYSDDVVHTTGNETISDDKTFNSLITKSTNLERGSIPATDIREDPIFISVDKNNRRTLAFYNYYFTSGYGRTVLYAYNHNTTDYDNIGLAFSFYTGSTNGKAIHPYASDAYDLGTVSNKWKDVNTVLLNGKTPAYDDDVVHKGGNETIAGVKTFTSSVVLDGNGRLYQAYATDYTKGGIPSSAIYQGLRFYDDQKTSTVANHITGAFEIQYGTDGYNKAYIGCRNYSDTTQLNYNVGLRVPNDSTRSIDFYPSVDNKINLGTSNYKWADINTVLLNGKTPDLIEEQGDGYIRYSNGIQICWANIPLHNLVQSVGYSYACNFPKTFIAAPSVTVNYSSAYSTDTGIAAEDIGTAGCTIWVKNTKLSVADFNVNYMAIGKWK